MKSSCAIQRNAETALEAPSLHSSNYDLIYGLIRPTNIFELFKVIVKSVISV